MMRQRLTAQLLAGRPARDPVAVARHLLAVQAQDPRAARLAIRARTTDLTAGDVDRALTDERSLVITWLNRGTLHLVCREDYGWLHALTTPPLFTSNARRLHQEGVTQAQVDRAMSVIERSLGREGPLTRGQLRARIARAHIRTDGQALVHLLVAACLRSIMLRGPMVGREHAYVLVRDWLARPSPVMRDRALAELARRYLAGHGPATDRDLARWAGLPLRDARFGLNAIAGELSPLSGGLVDLAGRPPAAPLPPPRLLGAFEPLLLGWRSREQVLDRHDAAVVSGGLFRPFALIRGRGLATWKIEDGRVSVQPFETLERSDAAALEADADDVLRFLASGAPRGRGASIAPPGRDSSGGRAHD